MSGLDVYIHIGSGKTGSTSIQQYLCREFDNLIESGVLYCGLTFDSLGVDKPWKEDPWIYSNEDCVRLMYEELEKYVDFARSYNATKLILSNESLSNRIDLLLPFLQKIKAKFNLYILYYVRSPEKWAVSAYEQWCIKHKTNRGKIFSFQSYLATRPYRTFINTIETINTNELGENLIVRNFDKSIGGDVLLDFCDIVGIDVSESLRVNESMDPFQRAAHYFVNDSIDMPITPKVTSEFLNFLKQYELISQRYLEDTSFREEHFNQDDLLQVKREINQFLSSENRMEESVDFGFLTKKENTVSPDFLNVLEFAVEAYRLLGSVDAIRLRDAAILLEDVRPELSLHLMKVAHHLRPTGEFIIKKIKEYEAKIAQS